MRRAASLYALVAFLVLGAACKGQDAPAAPVTPPAPAASPGLNAPSDVRLTGALPDLRTTVPAGQGELGRLTLEWRDNSDAETGFRIVQDCG